MSEIIYEDDDIVVINQRGYQDFCVISFGDAVCLANGSAFFADKALLKLGIASVGFMAKWQHWYCVDGMTKAIEITKLTLAGFKNRVLYGGSMGGFAALKFSRLLCASHVIALSPQWTIDPDEFGEDSGYLPSYRVQMRGMGIKSSDLDGEGWLFYDPLFLEDKRHAEGVLAKNETFHVVFTYYLRHHVTSVFDSSAFFSLLCSAILRSDHAEVNRLAAFRRRTKRRRGQGLIDAAARRHPLLIVRILRQIILLEEYEVAEFSAYSFGKAVTSYHDLPAMLVSLEDYKCKNSVIRRLFKDLAIVVKQNMVCNSYRLYTHHQTIIFFDRLRGEISHCSIPRAEVVLAFFNRKGEALLFIGHGKKLQWIGYDGRLNKIPFAFPWQAINAMDGGLGVGPRRLSAQPGGTIAINRTDFALWEIFRRCRY